MIWIQSTKSGCSLGYPIFSVWQPSFIKVIWWLSSDQIYSDFSKLCLCLPDISETFISGTLRFQIVPLGSKLDPCVALLLLLCCWFPFPLLLGSDETFILQLPLPVVSILTCLESPKNHLLRSWYNLSTYYKMFN